MATPTVLFDTVVEVSGKAIGERKEGRKREREKEKKEREGKREREK